MAGPGGRREAELLAHGGLLVPVLRNVYVPADVPVDLTVRQAAMGVVLPARLRRPPFTVSGPAATWLWCGGPAPDLVDVSRPPASGRSGAPGVRLHQRRVPGQDVVRLPAVRVTGPARTAAEICCTEPEPRALQLVTRLVALTGLTRDQLAGALDRLGPARGVARGRDVLARWPLAAGGLSRSACR